MEPRFAFAAQFWGDGAVVCRAIEGRPGPMVEQQFGEFRTWTQAQNFAGKLNEGLDLDPLAARRIVTSSILATACVVQEALNSKDHWEGTSVEIVARAAQLRCVFAELALALTLCRIASNASSEDAGRARRALLHAAKVLRDSTHFLKFHDGDYDQLKSIATGVASLQSTLQQVSACLPACLPALRMIPPHHIADALAAGNVNLGSR